jgi:hypothetical protein
VLCNTRSSRALRDKRIIRSRKSASFFGGGTVKTPAYLAATLVALLAVSACDDDPSARNVSSTNPVPTAPAPPAPVGDITLRSIIPESGATLTVRPCEWYPLYEDFCADRSPMRFDVQYEASVAEAVVTAGFYSGSQRCGIAYSALPGPLLTPGSGAVSFTVSTISVSDEAHPLLCPLPATTTRIVVQLWERGRPAVPLLTKEFDHTYTFTQR